MFGVTRLQPPTPDQPHYRPMSQFKPLPPIQELQQAFDYDPATGIFRNKYSRGKAKQGSLAGTFCPRGYLYIAYKRKKLLAHRLAWLLMTNDDPLDKNVDHKDRVTTHNWFSNLRLSTTSQNTANHIGKGWTRTPSGRYQAYIKIGSKNVYLGVFSTPDEASQVYIAKHIEVYGSFSPYFQ